MAITALDYAIWRQVAQSGLVPPEPDVLELGEANWYGDVELEQLTGDIQQFIPEPEAGDLLRIVQQALTLGPDDRLFTLAKVFYLTFLKYRSLTAIDLHGTAKALRYDLNEPVPLDRQFHIVINTGTAEHVFNQAQFFRTVHELTAPGGLMLHAFPLTGWLDHGFYSYNPTLVADLGARNGYTTCLWLYGEINPLRIEQVNRIEDFHEMARRNELGSNTLQYVLFQKGAAETPFAAPMQGYYAQGLSEQSNQDWKGLR